MKVLYSRPPPKEISDLEDKLKTRSPVILQTQNVNFECEQRYRPGVKFYDLQEQFNQMEVKSKVLVLDKKFLRIHEEIFKINDELKLSHRGKLLYNYFKLDSF